MIACKAKSVRCLMEVYINSRPVRCHKRGSRHSAAASLAMQGNWVGVQCHMLVVEQHGHVFIQDAATLSVTSQIAAGYNGWQLGKEAFQAIVDLETCDRSRMIPGVFAFNDDLANFIQQCHGNLAVKFCNC